MKEERDILILLLDPGKPPSAGLEGVPFFKAFFFWPSGKTEREESGSPLTEMDHSKYLVFNSSSRAKSRAVMVESPRVLLSKDRL